MSESFTQRPGERIDYDVDFRRRGFLATSDLIASVVSVEIETEGTITVDAYEHNDDRVKVWITGGAHGDDGKVEVIIASDAGVHKEQCFRVRIRDC